MARQAAELLDANGESSIFATIGGSVTFKTETNAAWNGTISFYATTDEFSAGADWFSVNAFNYGLGARARTDTLANTAQLWLIQAPAFTFIKVEITTYVAGTCYVDYYDAPQVQGTVEMYPLPTGDNVLGQVKVDAIAVAHGSNPTAVAGGAVSQLKSNRAGILYTIGGHPNTICHRVNYTAAQTDTAIITIGAGTKIVVTGLTITCDNANTVDVSATVGFGAATTPTAAGVVGSHPGIAAGGGFTIGDGSGILGVGADGEDLRITSEAPTTGSITVVVQYFTIES